MESQHRFLGSEFEASSPEDSLFHIIPVPYEATVSYGSGTAGGPAAILEASQQLEANDSLSQPGDLGIYTHPDINCEGGQSAVFERITRASLKVLKLGPHPAASCRIPVVLGGEHSISFAVLRAFSEIYGPENLGVLQFDAHADMRDRYEGNPHSHACVMRRVREDLGIQVYQLGVRASCLEEQEYRAGRQIPRIDARDLVPSGIMDFQFPVTFPPYLFVSFDVDGLDPSIMPSTGTPVPGGIGWYQALSLLESAASQRKIIGFDLVELAPIEQLHAPNYLAAELCHRIMGIIQRSLQ